MRDIDLLADWINDLNQGIREQLAELTEGELQWQPDPGGNSIGETVWHCARWLDVLNVQLLQNQPAEWELWHVDGWRERTGYDPRGIGYRGVGAITGYTRQEVEALPKLSAGELAEYTDRVCVALRDQLLNMPEGAPEQTAPGLKTRATAYAWIKDLMQGCFGHLGEIHALRAMQERRKQER